MRRCVFCQRAGQPMTREHVFARWLVTKVRGARLVASGGPATESAEATRLSRVIADVCAECNAGWMSTLEVRFRSLLFARPRAGALQAPDRITLSRWSTKTAVLLAESIGGTLGRAAERAGILSGMPEDLEVFIARRRRPRQPLDFAVDSGGDGDSWAPHVRSVAVFVDDLVAHVAPRGTLRSRHGTRLWPLRTHALRWETLPVITAPVIRDD
jgi:hypothetical protein